MSINRQRTPEEIQQDLHRELGQALNPDGFKPDPAKIDLKRYHKVRWFFAKAFLHVIWWDIVLNRPVLKWLRTPPLPRWQKIARSYRGLAVEMGGVLIKLGQFLSIRVDILPTEVTRELAGLQDEVPAERLEDVVSQIEADFGRPMADVFAWFSPEPVGAASLAQVHLARLPSGEEVVVKALRPSIDVLVETDLTAIALAIRWLKFYKRISKRVDLDWLAEEFTTVTRNELNLKAEGQNAERFVQDFTGDAQVYIPKIYWDYSAARTLTLENVGYIKIGDLAAIDAAGISRPQVAKKFYNIYMRQTFITNFVHADPHPGNVFVKPLAHPNDPEGTCFGPNDPVPYQPGRSFQIVFVDFGMVAVIPERLRAALREYAIGVGTRDAHKIVQSYVSAGVLLPGADLKRLEEAHEAMFERFWGVRMGQMRNVAFNEARYFLREDRPWAETIPFAERLAKEELQQNWRGWLQEIANLAQLILKLPAELDRVLTQAERGNLVVQTSLAPDARKTLQRLEQAINRLTWVVIAASLLIAGVNWQAGNQEGSLGRWFMVLALLAFVWGMFKKEG
ncbi:MAG: AarF/ABC1/UbiB kinase family protein [Chloroflexi bacterium]|nr:AarF/ABC1/UbiB kinase family protein [Chloroflexota bacterium]